MVALGQAATQDVLDLYRELGGVQDEPVLRPGSWDLCAGGLLVELDEELHFNRYRSVTLNRPWTVGLPWTASYLDQCAAHEADCLSAATWGGRWTNKSADRMFGPASPPGQLDSGHGAPRWKQRALYDAMKDRAAVDLGLPLVRLSVHDVVTGQRLGDALEGRSELVAESLGDLVAGRAYVRDA